MSCLTAIISINAKVLNVSKEPGSAEDHKTHASVSFRNLTV